MLIIIAISEGDEPNQTMVRIFKDGGSVDSVRNRQKFRGSDRFEFRKKGMVWFGSNFENTLWFSSVHFFLLKKNKTIKFRSFLEILSFLEIQLRSK
jgi:hypothetical protein